MLILIWLVDYIRDLDVRFEEKIEHNLAIQFS